MEGRSRFFTQWASVICYAFSLLLYLFDVISDIVLGKHLIHEEGIIILAFIFLPVIATFGLVIFKRCCGSSYKQMKKRDPDYKLSLLGIDWLNLDDNNNYTTAVTVILITLRLHIIRVYILLIKAAVTNNKKQKKKLDTRMRAEMFIENCFESLPQCCVQLYLFGNYSVVSHLQIVSFTLSTLNLVYSFTLAHAEREVAIYRNAPTRVMEKGVDLEPCSQVEYVQEEEEVDEGGLIKRSKRKGTVKLANLGESLVLKILDLGNPPPKKLSVSLDLILHKGTHRYGVTNTAIRSKQVSVRLEKAFFFWMRVINISIESPVFFLTAFPSISLFSCLFGKMFLLLYVPVAIHFVAEYWWWRPNVYKFVMNGSFHTIFLAFKLLERVTILAMICTWFIKVMNYSKPLVPSNTGHLPSLVWPTPNPFLLAVSTYEKDNTPKDWANDCKLVHEPKKDVVTENKQHKLIKVYRKLTEGAICSLDVSSFIVCIVYDMNVIGMIWEIINYIAFWFFKRMTRHETWKEIHPNEQSLSRIIFASIFESLCVNKHNTAAEFIEFDEETC